MVGATDPGKPMAQMRNRIDTQAAGTVDMDPATGARIRGARPNRRDASESDTSAAAFRD